MTKPKTFEEAQEQFTAAKEALKEAKTELREFMVENKIKKDKAPEDQKLVKRLEQLQRKVDVAQTSAENAKESLTELKPKKVRETKYVYPEGMTDKDKKKFRAAERRKLKNVDKPAKEEKPAGEKTAKKPLKKKEETEKED